MKAIVSVLGKDRVGITAAVCTKLAENNINILDISQTIMDGNFSMVMIVDMEKAACSAAPPSCPCIPSPARNSSPAADASRYRSRV